MIIFVVNHIHFTMRKIYVKPCLTVDCLLPEGDILGLSELGTTSFTINFADYNEKDLPGEADVNSQQPNLWGDDENI